MQNKICCIFNVAPHYNEPIYKLIDKHLISDFYIGDKIHLPIHLMDYSSLNGFKKILKYTPLFYNFYWQTGVMGIRLRNYNHIIITGEPFCLSTWLILIISKLFKIKTYLWTHGWYGNESFFKKTIKKMFFKLSTKVLLYGDYARDLMIDEGFKSEKLITIYNSLDYNNQLLVRNSLIENEIYNNYFGNRNPVIVFVGRIQKVKKLDMLLAAMLRLNQNKLRCNLIIIGEEVEKTYIKDLIDEYDLNKQVWLFGPCFDEKVIGELIFNANVCVSPGNVGLTSIHSLMYGTPVITHNNFCKQMPEFETITDGYNGSFFDENTIESLADKIKFWIIKTNQNRLDIRNNCYRVIDEKFNPNVQINILKNLFNNN